MAMGTAGSQQEELSIFQAKTPQLHKLDIKQLQKQDNDQREYVKKLE